MAHHGHIHRASASLEERSREVRTYAYALFIVILVFGVELAGGFAFNSAALKADAMHVFSDAVSILLSLYVAHRARLSADESRFRRICMRFSGLLLLGVLVWMGYGAWERFHTPPEVSSWGLVAAAIGLAGNIGQNVIVARLEHSYTKHAQLRHIIGDLLSNVVVIGSFALIALTGRMWWDPLASVFVIAIVGWFALDLLFRK